MKLFRCPRRHSLHDDLLQDDVRRVLEQILGEGSIGCSGSCWGRDRKENRGLEIFRGITRKRELHDLTERELMTIEETLHMRRSEMIG